MKIICTKEELTQIVRACAEASAFENCSGCPFGEMGDGNHCSGIENVCDIEIEGTIPQTKTDATRPRNGVFIPLRIWEDKTLSTQQKAILAEINRLDAGSGCRARNQDLADFLDVSERRVLEILKDLRDKGFIVSTYIYREGTQEIEGRVLKIVGERYE